jgi:cellulase/cellobiase CelA1
MRYSEGERRIALIAALLALAAVAVLGLYLIRGWVRPPPAGRQTATAHQTSSSPPVNAGATQSAGPRALTAGYRLGGRWDGGFNAEMVVTNIGSEPVEGWTVRLEMPAGVSVLQAWSAQSSQVGTAVTLRSQPWNTYIAPGGAVHFGFQATGSAADPSSCTVNGKPC